MRLLLVDKDAEFQTICTNAFSSQSQSVELVLEETPDRALRRLRQGEIDIVFLDLETARCDQATHSIVHFVERSDGAPIVLLIEPRHADDTEDFRKLGVTDCIVKSKPLHLHLLPQLARLIAANASRTGNQKRLDHEQREISRVFSAVMATLDDAIIVLDARGRITRVSSTANKLLGGSRDAILGTHIDEILIAEDGGPIGDQLETLEPSHKTTIDKVQLAHEDGQPGFLRLRLSAFGGDSHDILYLGLLETADQAPIEIIIDAELDSAPESLADRLVALAPKGDGKQMACPAPEIWQLRFEGVRAARASLGNRWPEMEQIISRIAATVLNQELSSIDAYDHDRHGDMLIHVAHKLGVNHMKRASMVIKSIQRAILESQEIDRAALEADANLPASTRQELARLDVRMQVLPLRHLEPMTANDAISIAATALNQSADRLPRDQLTALKQVALAMPADLAMVQARGGEPSTLQLFVPDGDLGETSKTKRRQGQDYPETSHHLNLLTLSHAAGMLLEEMSGDDVLTVIDLDFVPLTHRRMTESLAELAMGLPETIRKGLVYNLTNLPPGSFLPKIQEISIRLQPCSAFRALEITDLRTELPDLEHARIPLVIVPFKDIEGQLRTQANLLQKFILHAHEHGARVLIRGISRQLSLRLREETDVDLICRA